MDMNKKLYIMPVCTQMTMSFATYLMANSKPIEETDEDIDADARYRKNYDDEYDEYDDPDNWDYSW